jgi:hypothetical protein
MAKRSSSKKIPSAPALRVISGDKGAAAEDGEGQKPVKAQSSKDQTARGKRVQFDPETWHALNLLARDRMMTFQELADEAFRDLLRKHDRPTDLKDALRRSLKDAKPRQPGQHRKGAKDNSLEDS